MKVTKKTIFEVDYNDLNEAISEEFGIDYEIVAYEKLGNDMTKAYDIRPEPLDDYDQSKLKQGQLYYLTRSLLCEMCYRGKIEPGEYVVEICW